MLIYKILRNSEWQEMQKQGRYLGSDKDQADGFLHFSTEEQLEDTVEKHYAGLNDLVVLAVDPSLLDARLVYEHSRGGELFPHVYGTLGLDAVAWAKLFQP